MTILITIAPLNSVEDEDPMTRVAITELKAKLSEYLAAIRAGEEVIVTDRGRPVARMLPIEGERELEARMDRLVRSGLVRPPRVAKAVDVQALRKAAPADPEGRALAALLEDRRGGR